MKKYGAATAMNPGALVVGEDDHHIIETVGPAHGLVARRVGQAHRPVVVAVAGLVAPAIELGYRPLWEPRSRWQSPVAPVHDSQEPPPADGGSAVAFPFQKAAS